MHLGVCCAAAGGQAWPGCVSSVHCAQQVCSAGQGQRTDPGEPLAGGWGLLSQLTQHQLRQQYKLCAARHDKRLALLGRVRCSVSCLCHTLLLPCESGLVVWPSWHHRRSAVSSFGPCMMLTACPVCACVPVCRCATWRMRSPRRRPHPAPAQTQCSTQAQACCCAAQRTRCVVGTDVAYVLPAIMGMTKC